MVGMGEAAASQLAEDLLTAFPGIVSGKRVKAYMYRLAKFPEGVGKAAIEFFIENARQAPSIAELLQELNQRCPERAVEKPGGYPDGLHPEASRYVQNGREYVRMPNSERERYLASEARKLEAARKHLDEQRGFPARVGDMESIGQILGRVMGEVTKQQLQLEGSREAARALMRAMLNKNPWRKCDSCGKDIGAVANLTKFIEKCAQARWGDPIDGRLECDECAA